MSDRLPLSPTPAPPPSRPQRPFGLHLRIDFAGAAPQARIGPGKIALMEAVGRTGSISAAGRSLGMSYRRAWLLIDAVNHLFDRPLVEAIVGGRSGGGARLTPLGEDLVAAYRSLEAKTMRQADADLKAFTARVMASAAEDAHD
ncbi:winged helix-turn-helix domain-containing protein [Chelatococcus reniformis]|uniref:HTH lysR-type domain-containing protein n=1 Tax=Chelatococcus reniformis TaxID=1494448 RepID=A0A916UB97_9HYPH|nr:winged helix-turn-helix domain-containing protein [Chelatococcus reniformis]GGC66598.1 hypothetical protein GCM10010994_26500 [Chelatococcus reniformis]